MTEYYTIKQIADLVGVSKTSVVRAIKYLGLLPSQTAKNRQYYANADVELIKKYINPLNDNRNKPKQIETGVLHQIETQCNNEADVLRQTATKSQQTETDVSKQVEQPIYEILKEQLDIYKEQLNVKDKQIDTLNQQVSELHALLAREQELTKAQADKVALLERERQEVTPTEQEQAQDSPSKPWWQFWR